MVSMRKIATAGDRNWQVTGIGRQSNALADDQNWKNLLFLKGFAMADDRNWKNLSKFPFDQFQRQGFGCVFFTQFYANGTRLPAASWQVSRFALSKNLLLRGANGEGAQI